jgi:peptidoglycan-N-acetylglucosamine deacetylase
MKNLLLIQPKAVLKKIYPKAIWNFNRTEKNIYLTFDDGPIPGVTEWVLDELKKHSAKATFFCIGANILKNEKIFERIKQEGHTVANHTMFHSKGLNCGVSEYVKEVNDCEKYLQNRIFRPPYGQMKRNQYRTLLLANYQIIMWDVISYDYEKIAPEKCLKNVIKNTKNGSVVLFHDSEKAEKNVKHTLPLVLEHFSSAGFSFKAIAAKTFSGD